MLTCILTGFVANQLVIGKENQAPHLTGTLKQASTKIKSSKIHFIFN